MSGHRVAHDMAKAPLLVPDPGASGKIAFDRYGGICELVTAAAETRTLHAPTAPGIRATLRMKTDGGDATVTVTGGCNVSVNTTAVFADVGDQLDMISVSAAAGGYRWEILTNTGSVSLS